MPFVGLKPSRARFDNRFERPARSSLDRAFPNDPYPPPGGCQRLDGPRIVLPVLGDLCRPEFRSGRRLLEQVAIMAMPETAVGKEHGVAARKDEVWLTRECRDMHPIPEAEGMQSTAQDQFRLRVLATYAGHHPATDLRRDDVSHRPRPKDGLDGSPREWALLGVPAPRRPARRRYSAS